MGFGPGDDSLVGRPGNDQLWAGSGNNELFGGAGDDQLIDGQAVGNDHHNGGAGTDFVDYRFTGFAGVVIDLQAGTSVR